MSFFSSSPEPVSDESREPYRRLPRIHGPSPDEVGRPISASFVAARSARAAIVVQAIRVHSTGCVFEIEWIVRRTTETTAEWQDTERATSDLAHRGRRDPDGQLVGVQLADGAIARSNDRFDWRTPGTEPRLVTTGGSGSSNGSERAHGHYELWLTPLPPAPTVELICAWPRFDVPETRHTIDTTAIREAATNAHWVWPDDADLPADED